MIKKDFSLNLSANTTYLSAFFAFTSFLCGTVWSQDADTVSVKKDEAIKVIQQKNKTNLTKKIPKKPRPWLKVSNACSSSEKWVINEAWAKYLKIPAEVIELYEDQPTSESDFQNRYTKVIELQKRYSSLEYKPFLQYWTWRSMLGLKLPAVARAGFGILLSENYVENESLIPIVKAALGCSIEVKNIYSSFQWTAAEKKVLNDFPFAHFIESDLEKLAKVRAENLFSEMISNPETVELSAHSMSDSQEKTPINNINKNIGKMGRTGKIYESLLNVVRLVMVSDDVNIKIRELERILGAQEKPPAIDWIYLTLGRLYYEKGDFLKSRASFEKVKSKSIWFDEAVLGQSWASLLNGEYDKAVGMAYGMEASGYQNKFLPETSLIASMAYLEVCNYPASFQGIDTFRKRYLSIHHWLKNFSTADKSGYQLVTEYLKGKKGVPVQILGSWVSSVAFERGQQEINQLIDERSQFKKVAEFVREEKNIELNKNWKIISDFAAKEFPRFERELVQVIDQSLKNQATAMLSRTEDLIDNAEFVEVEILNSASEGLIAKRKSQRNQLAGVKEEEEETVGRHLAGGQVVGGFDTEKEKGEVWNDEVGLFRAQLKNQCVKNKRVARKTTE